MKSNKYRSFLFLVDNEGRLDHMYQADSLSQNPVISLRLKALNHQTQFGWQSTCHAFGIGKSSLYRWKKVYEISNHKVGKPSQALYPSPYSPSYGS